MKQSGPTPKSTPVASILDAKLGKHRSLSIEPRIELFFMDGKQRVNIVGKVAFIAIIVVSLSSVAIFFAYTFSAG